MSNMDSTYSPHSPDLSTILTSSPKAQQFSKSSISRQSYAPRSPTLPFLGSNSLDKNTFHYAPNSYASNLTSNPAGSFDNSGELFPCDVRQMPLSIPSTGFPSAQNLVPMPPTHNTLSSYRGSREKYQRKSISASMLMPQYADPNPQNIEIKTKFPVARIKRIMQADEEVGKVAQVTPVAVSKALELFMIALVTGAANKAREKGSKKVSAQHLKLVVDGQPERFDFLAEIVGRFGESSENASDKANRKRKEESESASEEEREKIKKRGRGRKKKSGD